MTTDELWLQTFQSVDFLPSGCFEQVNFHLFVFISLLICEIKVAILQPVCVP